MTSARFSKIRLADFGISLVDFRLARDINVMLLAFDGQSSRNTNIALPDGNVLTFVSTRATLFSYFSAIPCPYDSCKKEYRARRVTYSFFILLHNILFILLYILLRSPGRLGRGGAYFSLFKLDIYIDVSFLW